MHKPLFALALVLTLGCATASYDPETGKTRATALGQAMATANDKGATVKGGALSDGLIGVLKPLVEAVRGFFGGTPPTVIVNMPDEVTIKSPAETP